MAEWQDDDFRIIDDERFFVRASDAGWIEISEDAFKRFTDVWDIAGREAEPPVPGRVEDGGRDVSVRLPPLGEPLRVDAD